MSTAHVCFADVPLSSPSSSSNTSVTAAEGHRSTFEALNNDATLLQRQCNRPARDRSISPASNSTMPSTPRYERNMGFFRQLSRRFGLRSNDDLVYSGSNEEDNQSSSTDSCSSHRENGSKDGQQQAQPTQHQQQQYLNASNIMTASMMTMSITEHISCASSETSSTVDIDEQQQQHRQTYDKENGEHEVEGEKEGGAKNKHQAPVGYHKDRKSFARSSFSRLQRRSTSSIRRAFEAFSLSSRSLSCSGTTPPPPSQLSAAMATHLNHTSSASSSSTTPIKSALKSASNLELNKRSASSASSSASASATSANAAAAATASALKSSTKSKTKPPPQRILRQPVSYTYLKGISGLPTQRVPRNSVCCQYARR